MLLLLFLGDGGGPVAPLAPLAIAARLSRAVSIAASPDAAVDATARTARAVAINVTLEGVAT